MARRRKSRRGGGKRFYLGPTLGLVGYAFAMKHNWDRTAGWNPGRRLTFTFTGIDTSNPTWDETTSGNVIATFGPLAAGVIIHKAAGAAGLNKQLPKGINL